MTRNLPIATGLYLHLLVVIWSATPLLAQTQQAAPNSADGGALQSETVTTGEKASGTSESAQTADVTPDEMAKLIKSFETMMSRSALLGTFTMVPLEGAGDPDSKPEPPMLIQERYEIRKVKKLNKGDFWIITARIKYAKYDVVVPVPVEVKWAGKTPVITLDNVTIPGMGTFDARVLFSGKRYAGTWRHDDKGGHMFGMVEKLKNKPRKKPISETPAAAGG